MAKKDMVAFRNAINGYNKNDVNKYIQKLNNEFTDYEKKSVATLDDIKLELENEKKKDEQLDELRIACDEMLQVCAQKEQRIKEQEQTILSLNEKLDRQKEQLDALTAERDNLLARLDEMGERLRNLDGANSKSERYDEISSQIGDLIISAKKTANEIIDNAKNDAGKIKEEINTQLTTAKEEATGMATSALNAINAILRATAEEALSEILSYVKDAQEEMSRLLVNLEGKNRQISDNISAIRSQSTSGIQKELAKIDFDNWFAINIADQPAEDDEINAYLDLTETKEV